MEIDDDSEIAALIGPELSDEILPDSVMLPLEELCILLIEPQPVLRVLVSGWPGLLRGKDAINISDHAFPFRLAALALRFSDAYFGTSSKWETHITIFL